jgi:hypothetical protein
LLLAEWRDNPNTLQRELVAPDGAVLESVSLDAIYQRTFTPTPEDRADSAEGVNEP